MSEIEIRHLTVEYQKEQNDRKILTGRQSQGETAALKDLSVRVQQGQFVSMIGASGCGKSTLLKVLSGLLQPTKGEIRINGQTLIGPGLDRGIVFQNYSLFPWMTAIQNVAFGIRQAFPKLTGKEVHAKAALFLEKVGLSGYENQYPLRLSGGMQQRVAIARTLAMDPPVLLLDEPFGALDAKTRMQLQDLLLRLWKGDGKRKTVILVTHDIEEAILLSEKIVILTNSPGRVYKEVPVPFVYSGKRKELVASPAYRNFRNQISDYFYQSMRESSVVRLADLEAEQRGERHAVSVG